MTEYAACDIPRVLDDLARNLKAPRVPGEKLPKPTLEALDIVTHAVEFSQTPNGFEVWRTALWQRHLTEEGRSAVTTMLEYVNSAVLSGQQHLIWAICDCLGLLLTPGQQDSQHADTTFGCRPNTDLPGAHV
jgi:hypothetical protein